MALRGAWIAGTLVISIREPVITQTALLPSGHASSTLPAWRPVNVSVAGCLSSSLLYTLLHTRGRSNTLSQRIQITGAAFSVYLFALDDGKLPDDALGP